jgi:hypothetical protein
MDGGRIGWGLVNLFWRLGEVPGTLLLFVLWLLMIMTGFGMWAVLERWLLKLAGEIQPAELVTQPEVRTKRPLRKRNQNVRHAKSIQSTSARIQEIPAYFCKPG